MLFLKKKLNTHFLLFIDSDIDFEPDTIMKMIKADKDIIAYPYPLKDINPGKKYKRK
jgi:hypothetical protein